MSKKRSEYVGDFLTIEYEVPLRQRIADLEAKLAESEEKYKKAYQEGLLQKQFDKDMEIEQLKQQLAKTKEDYEQLDLSTGYYISDLKEELTEKDEEIKKLKTLIDAIDKYGQYDKDTENLVLFNPENCYSNGHKLIIKTDKIDYGVELLEKVKERLEEDRNNAQALLDPTEYEDYHELIGVVRGYRNSIYEVQKIITEIKDGK